MTPETVKYLPRLGGCGKLQSNCWFVLRKCYPQTQISALITKTHAASAFSFLTPRETHKPCFERHHC